MRRLRIAVPPLAEQREILRRVTEYDEAIATERRSLAKLALVKTAIADDLLTGRVRVKVDGGDAP